MIKLLPRRREAAQSLSLSIRSIDKLIASGQLPTTRIGRSVRVHVGTLEAFASTGSITGTKTPQQAANAL